MKDKLFPLDYVQNNENFDYTKKLAYYRGISEVLFLKIDKYKDAYKACVKTRETYGSDESYTDS